MYAHTHTHTSKKVKKIVFAQWIHADRAKLFPQTRENDRLRGRWAVSQIHSYWGNSSMKGISLSSLVLPLTHLSHPLLWFLHQRSTGHLHCVISAMTTSTWLKIVFPNKHNLKATHTSLYICSRYLNVRTAVSTWRSSHLESRGSRSALHSSP